MATIEQTTEVGGPPATSGGATGTGHDAARHGDRRHQHEARDVAVPLVGLPLLRCLHRRRTSSTAAAPTRRARARRTSRHPVHVGDVVHPADELADDGARARRDPARRPPPVPDLDPRPPRCSAPRSSPARSSSSPSSTARVCTSTRASSARRFFILTGLPRRARDDRHHLAAVAVGPVDAEAAPGGARREGRDRRALLALRRRRVDRDLHGRSTWSHSRVR